MFKGEVENIAPGKTIEVGKLSAEVMRTSLRVIGAAWLFESTTQTLFTSDTFAFVTAPSASASALVRPAEEQISLERIKGYLNKKFDWVRGSDPTVIIGELEKLHGSRTIERICPTYGCIIEGRSAVDRVFERTVAALQDLSRLPPRRALEGFQFKEERSLSRAK